MTPPASLIGVAIACAGNILISLALTIQKLAHRRQEEAWRLQDQRSQSQTSSISPHSSPNGTGTPPRHVGEGAYLTSRLWWVGLAMMGLGEIGNFVSYGFAPASVVAPLGTVALIANCVFAPLVLGESFTRRNMLGVGLAIVGAVTVVWSAGGRNPRMSPGELITALTATPFIVHTCITLALIGLLSFLSPLEEWGWRYVVIDVGVCALFGGYTVMATKALSSLLSSSLFKALKEPVAWGAIVVLVVTSVLQIKFLNRALMHFESKEVIPVQFVFFSMSAIIGSAVLYQEFQDVTFSKFVNFAFGISTTFVGVYFLTTPGDTTPREIPLDEETPLLVPPPVVNDEATPIPPRLSTRASNSNLGIGINSQGGLLLLATSPPVSPTVGPKGILSHGRRTGSVSSARSISATNRARSASNAQRLPLPLALFGRRNTVTSATHLNS